MTIDTSVTESNIQDINSETPALIGQPTRPAFEAFRSFSVRQPNLTLEESEMLGQAIYDGRLAAARLNDEATPLTVEEYFDLEKKVEQGLQAREVVVVRMLRLVIGLAGKFSYNQERQKDFDRKGDMAALGNLALVKSLNGYVHNPGVHIVNFAKRCVTNAMIGEIMDQQRRDTGRSWRMQKTLRAIDAAYRQSRTDGEDVTYFEVAERLGYTQERVEQILKLGEVTAKSLDSAPFGKEERGRSTVLKSIIEDRGATDAYFAAEQRVQLEQVWEVATELHRRQILSDDEWRVFNGRYRDGLTQEAVGQAMDGKSQSNVHAIEQRALKKIRAEVTTPGYYDRKADAAPCIVQTATNLLELLGIPVTRGTDIIRIATNLVDNTPLTPLQRETMHAIMGTKGKSRRPHEIANEREVRIHAIYNARLRATNHILQAWETMTADEQASAMQNTPEAPKSSVSRGIAKNFTPQTPAPEKRKPSSYTRESILSSALELGLSSRLSKKKVAELAGEGSFADVQTIEAVFGSWPNFIALYKQLKSIS